MLRWRVDPVPTGRYRSFQTRGWPTGEYPDGRAAASLHCDDEYTPARARGEQPHGPIKVRVAQWFSPEERGERAAFEWRTVKRRAATLEEAKALAVRVLRQHPEFQP